MRLRLFLSFALIILVAVAGVALIARQEATQEVRQFMFGGGSVALAELAGNLEAYYRESGSWEGVQEAFWGAEEHAHGQGYHGGMGGGGMMIGQRLVVADAQGNVVARSSESDSVQHLGEGELGGAVALQLDGETIGYLTSLGGVMYSQGDEEFLTSRIDRAALIAGLIAGGAALLLALLLASRLLRPVRQLTAAARRMAEGDLSQRVAVRGDDELALLGHTFNQMADSLQQAGEARRAMTADIAHELRTPLAVQRANLEALQDGVYAMAPENLAPILEQNHLLARLVDDLRMLALADAGQLRLEYVPTDLSELARRVVEQYQMQAQVHQIDLSLQGAEQGKGAGLLTIDPMRIEQVLSNLISNALRHTPDGGSICVGLSSTANQVFVTVHDSGGGIPADALPHIFERFYRADRSRSRAEGGSGLGLAIARHLAQAHGGSLVAENHAQGGAVFTLSLPRTEDD